MTARPRTDPPRPSPSAQPPPARSPSAQSTSAQPRRAGYGDVTTVLDDVASVGPFFELPVVPHGDAPVPFARLHTDPGPLAERVARVRTSLGSDQRVAASIAFQALVARLVSAPLAAVALHAALPDLAGLCRRPGGDDPWAPGLTGSDGIRTPDPREDARGAAAVLGEELLERHLVPLVGAVRGLVPVSGHVLRGNVASALAGAARVLDTARPGARPALLGLLGALLEHPSLAGTGTLLVLEPGVADTEWGFRRRSCCLYYKVPGGGTCADCVLDTR